MYNLDLNKRYENYSKEDGTNCSSLEYDKFTLLNKNNVCRSCNEENAINSNYCKACGENLSEVKVNTNERKASDLSKTKLNIVNILNQNNFKSMMLTSIVSLIILFAMSFLIKQFIGFEVQELNEIMNPIYIMLGLNLGQLYVSSSTMMGSGYLEIHIGFLILTITPILALIISNIVFMRKYNNSAKSVLKNSLGVGFIYSLILTIISIVTKVGSNPYDMIQYGYSLDASYSPITILVNSFIIASLATFMLGFKKKYESENVKLSIIKKAINTVFLGYTVVILVLSIITLVDSSYLHEFGMYGYVNDASVWLIISQLAMYMWAFANFIPVFLSNYLLSIFGLISSDLFMNTKLIFIVMLAISSLILLVCGCNLKRKYKDSDVKVVLTFSIVYAIFMGIMAIFSNITVGGNLSLLSMENYQGSILLGFSVVPAIINSFIYSYIMVSIGYKLYVFED